MYETTCVEIRCVFTTRYNNNNIIFKYYNTTPYDKIIIIYDVHDGC